MLEKFLWQTLLQKKANSSAGPGYDRQAAWEYFVHRLAVLVVEHVESL
jgi:hypothetical protein